MNSEYIVGNRGGIVYTQGTQTSAGSSSTNAVYTLPNHVFRYLGLAGLMVVSISIATGTVLGISIQVNNLQLTATNNEGSPISTLPVGDHLVFFNKTNNTIKFFL